MHSFRNDYMEGAHPFVLERIVQTNNEQHIGYTEDNLCKKGRSAIRSAIVRSDNKGTLRSAGIIPAALQVEFVAGGTMANLVSIAASLRPHECAIAAPDAHINVHETGAIEACGHKVLVTDDADGRKQLEGWLAGIDQPYSLASLGDNDWAHSWQKYYKPMPVGERLYIVPEWERGEPVPAGKAPLYLNPGLTFGTGSHASTQLCLMGLERYTVPGKPVLDLGCGSGILSIAALVLGASAAAAVDIDPKAVDVAYENAALNGIGRDRYTVRAGNVLTDGALVAELARRKYALVLANIVADVIIPLSAQVPALLEQDGVFLCSGIIDTRAGEVEAALERNGLAVFERREQNGWVALEAQKG